MSRMYDLRGKNGEILHHGKWEKIPQVDDLDRLIDSLDEAGMKALIDLEAPIRPATVDNSDWNKALRRALEH